jgi:hypothetical protein
MGTGEQWVEVERPGYFGSHRAERHQEYDGLFGAGRWRLSWRVGEHSFSRAQMTMLYEDAYFAFLSQRPEMLERLVAEASDVYDDAPSNMASGLDYERQETERTHVQDIAIRRVVTRLGRAFAGPEPIQIRDALGEHPLSLGLSPGQVPFHLPDLIILPELTGWWLPGSVESFYQSNKVLERLAS